MLILYKRQPLEGVPKYYSMRIAFAILIILHGLIHLIGLIQGFELKEIKALSSPVSKAQGIFWLITALLILSYAILFLTNFKYIWVVGFVAVILSQVLIISFWQDARFGTILNVILLIVSVIQFRAYKFHNMVAEETDHLIELNQGFEEKIVQEEDLSELPEPVKKWLLKSNVIGKPYIAYGKVVQEAKMKLKPDQEKWMSATAIQHTFIENPALIWSVEVKMNDFVFFLGRDKFVNGKGEMLIKVNALVNVVNDKGFKIDEGSIQRFLGEMVWFPTLALSPLVRWEELDNRSAKATIEYKGTKGDGIFYFNAEGDFEKFSAMRFKGNEEDSERHEWVIKAHEYSEFEGIRIPSKMTATWKLKEGDWTWLQLEISDAKFNESAIDN